MTDDEKYYREDWMTDDQWSCWQFIGDLFCGFHHVDGKPKDSGPHGIQVSTHQCHRFCTFDFDRLTRAVVMAHDRCIRFGVGSSGPRMIKLYVHQRHKRDGRMSERHPTMEDAVAMIRNGRSAA